MKENEFETEEKLTQQPEPEKTADEITASPTVTPVEEEQTEEVQAEETKEEEITEEQTQEEASAEPAKKGKKKIELQFRGCSKEKRCFEQFRHFPKIFPKMFAVFP